MEFICPKCRGLGLVSNPNGSQVSCDQCAGRGRLTVVTGGDSLFIQGLLSAINQQMTQGTATIQRVEIMMTEINEALQNLGAAVDGVSQRMSDQHDALQTQIDALQASLADAANPEADAAVEQLRAVADSIMSQVTELNSLGQAVQSAPTEGDGGEVPAGPPAGDLAEEPPTEDPAPEQAAGDAPVEATPEAGADAGTDAGTGAGADGTAPAEGDGVA